MTRDEFIALHESERADWLSSASDEDVIALRQLAINGDHLVGFALAHAQIEVCKRGAQESGAVVQAAWRAEYIRRHRW